MENSNYSKMWMMNGRVRLVIFMYKATHVMNYNSESNWIELDWIELNWIELNWIELNCIALNWIALNWIELNRIESNRIESNRIELNWIELFHTVHTLGKQISRGANHWEQGYVPPKLSPPNDKSCKTYQDRELYLPPNLASVLKAEKLSMHVIMDKFSR